MTKLYTINVTLQKALLQKDMFYPPCVTITVDECGNYLSHNGVIVLRKMSQQDTKYKES